jgi:hypothetical protein
MIASRLSTTYCWICSVSRLILYVRRELFDEPGDLARDDRDQQRHPHRDHHDEQDVDDRDPESAPQAPALEEIHQWVEQIDDDQGKGNGGEQDAKRPEQEVEGRERDAEDRGESDAEETPSDDPIPDRLGMDDPMPERSAFGGLHGGRL